MAATAQSVTEICAEARAASLALARAETAQKDAALEAMALALRERSEEILAANARDVEAGVEACL